MIRASIRRPVAVTMAYLAVALMGVAAWRNVPIELLPDTELPRLFIDLTWRGASPQSMEAFVTAPVEAVVQQIGGVEKISSESREQRASIAVEFSADVDMDFARLELSERLAAARDELPANVELEVRPYVPEEFRDQSRAFLQYVVTGPHTLESMRAHLERVVVPALAQVEGVADVSISGGRDRLLEIELDEGKAQALGLRIERVARLVRELDFVREAGVVETEGLLRTVAIRERAESAAEIRDLPLLVDGGRTVRVKDVARVHDTYEDPWEYFRIDGYPAVSFDVYKEHGSNVVAAADRVKAAVAGLEGLHPPGTRFLLEEDESEEVRAQLSDLRLRALISAAVIFVVLLLFLRSFRSAAIVFATIAFSVLITLNLIYFGGFTLNVLTLMGLAMGFGLIVDNAIVVLENVYRRRHGGESAAVAADRGSREVLLPIVAATATTVVVLVPFVYLQDELRIYYVPLAIVVGFSLIASLFVAFSFIPAVASRLLARPLGRIRRVGRPGSAAWGAVPDAVQDAAPTGFVAAGERGRGGVPARDPSSGRPLYLRFYAGLVGFTLRHPVATVLIAVATLAGSYHVFDTYVTRGVLWRFWGGQDNYISINISLPRGADLERVDELTRYFEARLKAMPEPERFETRVRQERATITVTFPDALERTSIPPAIKEQLVAYSHQFGGADVRVYGYGPSFYGGGGSPPNYTIKVLGYNYEAVRELAEDLGGRLERFSRIREVDTNSSGRWVRDKATELVLRIDRSRLGRYDLTVRELLWQIRSAVRGTSMGQPILVGGEELAFEVKLSGNRVLDLYELRELLVPTSDGAVRLGDVAELHERNVLNRVQREDQQYVRYVSYEFRGPAKLGDRVQEGVVAATHVPPGYTIDTRQEWRWDDDERRQIFGVLLVAIVLIFMVTAALFESLRQPLCVLFTVPMALVGVFLVFFYSGASFTREAYVGVIMMGGIVVNNAILLVDHINTLRRTDGEPLDAAVVRGTLERVRPILMTSATTIFGLLPLVLFSETADANIWNALGYALIGGLASSTFFVLSVTPALYYLFEGGRGDGIPWRFWRWPVWAWRPGWWRGGRARTATG